MDASEVMTSSVLTVNVDAILLLGPEDSEYRLAPLRGGFQARLKVLF